MFAWAFATLASPVLSALELYVAPHGNDDWSGKLAQPNATHTDGPFATLNGARRALRHLQAGGGRASRGARQRVHPRRGGLARAHFACDETAPAH